MLLIYFQKNASFDGFFLSVLLKPKKERRRKKSEEFKEFEVERKFSKDIQKLFLHSPLNCTLPGKESKLHAPFFPFLPPQKNRKKKKDQRIHKARNLEKPPVSRKTYIPRVIEQLSRNSGENRRNTDASFESGPGINLYSARSPIPSRNNKDNSDRARQPVYKVSLSSPLSLPPRFANERDLNASRVRFSGGI